MKSFFLSLFLVLTLSTFALAEASQSCCNPKSSCCTTGSKCCVKATSTKASESTQVDSHKDCCGKGQECCNGSAVCCRKSDSKEMKCDMEKHQHESK